MIITVLLVIGIQQLVVLRVRILLVVYLLNTLFSFKPLSIAVCQLVHDVLLDLPYPLHLHLFKLHLLVRVLLHHASYTQSGCSCYDAAGPPSS